MKSAAIIMILVLALTSVVLSGEGKDAPIKDDDFSVYPGSVFDVPTPPAVQVNEARPGKNALIDPMFHGAPPQVPHGIDEFLPITGEDNGCIECHRIEKEEGEDAPLLPESHRQDLRGDAAKFRDDIVGSRWVCTACHVPTTDAKPLLGE